MKGFVTFVTPNYEELMKTTIESVIEFSEYPVVVCGVGYTPNIIKHERVIYKKLEKNLPNIFYYKFKCILESGLSEGIYIEADDILNYKIDELFAECPTGQFPKGPIHPNDPNNQKKVMQLLGGNREESEVCSWAYYLFGHM